MSKREGFILPNPDPREKVGRDFRDLRGLRVRNNRCGWGLRDLRGLRVRNNWRGRSLRDFRGLRVRNNGGDRRLGGLRGLCVRNNGGGPGGGEGFARGGEVLVEGEGLAEAGDGGGIGLRQ